MHRGLARPTILVGAALAYVAALVLAVMFGVPAASADSAPAGQQPGDARYYRSSVLAVQPEVPGLTVSVGEAGQVTLVNLTGQEVVVPGYAGEPFLRITGGRMVLRNRAALTTALTEGRTPGPTTGPDGEPLLEWEHLSHDGRFTWADVRTTWSAPERPPVVRQDEHAEHRVVDWALDLSVGEQPVVVRGAVDWIGTPRADRDEVIGWTAVGVVLAGTLLALAVRRSRHRRRVVRGPSAAVPYQVSPHQVSPHGVIRHRASPHRVGPYPDEPRTSADRVGGATP
jgi:hypothetical protein